MKRVSVQQAGFDPGTELDAFASGGVASFIGHVRGDGGLVSLTLEHYPGMTEATLDALVDEAIRRWSLEGAAVIHRIGRMAPGERIVMVVTAAPHRRAALDACAFLIDRLKTDVPFWKKEEFADGVVRWVEAQARDDEAASRWHG